MSSTKNSNALLQFACIIFGSICSIWLLEYLIERKYDRFGIGENVEKQSEYFSSIWCRGNGHQYRRCRATNLCYKRDTNDFIFINHDRHSVQSGIPNDRFHPTLATLTSVIDHNQFNFNYVTVKSSNVQRLFNLYTVKFVNKSTLITGRFKPDNLMHIIHDDLLPIYWTLLEFSWIVPNVSGDNYTIFFADSWETFNNQSFYSQALKGDLEFSSQMSSEAMICFKEAVIGLNLDTIWYQYGFRRPQSALVKSTTESLNVVKAIQSLQDSITGSFICNETYGVLIIRNENRRILNMNELLSYFESQMKMVKLELTNETDLISAIKLVSCSRLLVGVHGSGLILSAFLRSSTQLIEIFPYGLNADNYTPYKTLSQLKKVFYQSWVNGNISNTVTHPEYPSIFGGIEHLPERIQAEVRNIDKPLEPHLCCDNVHWLHRIYQDTIVDIDNFTEQIKIINIDSPTVMSRSREARDAREAARLVSSSPSPVANVVCKRDLRQYKLEWSRPWSLDYTYQGVISYELLIQLTPSLKQFLQSSSNSISFDSRSLFNQTENPLVDQENPLDENDVLIWIRAINDGFKGPFTFVNCD